MSVGAKDAERQIKHVAAGQISSTSTDAINGSQLFATNQQVATNTTNIQTNADNIAKGINFGDGATSNKFALGDTINVKGDANVTSTTTTDGVQLALANTISVGDAATGKPVTIDGTTGTVSGLTNITFDPSATYTGGVAATQEQLKSVSDVANKGFNLTTSASEGTVSGTTLEQVGPGETVTVDAGKNIAITQAGNKVTVATSDTPEFTSVKLGDATNNTTLTSTANGLDVGGDKITNVAAGVNSTDAVNVSQLQSSAAAARTEVAAGTNVTSVVKTAGAAGQDIYTVNADGAKASAGSAAVTVTAGAKDANNVTDYAIDLAQSTKDDIGKGVTALETVQTKGLTFTGDSGTTGAKLLGESVAVTGDTNITTTATAAGVQVSLNKNLDLTDTGSVKTGNTTINNAGITITNPTNASKSVSLTTAGLNNGGNQITNVAAGVNSTDAVNVSQLQSSAAAARTEVAAGTNVTSVVKTAGAAGQDIYTVNADGAKASAGSAAVTVTAGAKDANNVTDYAIDLAQSTKDDIGKGVTALETVQTKGLTFTGDSGTTGAKLLGESVAVTGDTNITTTATAAGVQVSLNKNLDLTDTGSVKTGNTTINNAGITITNPTNASKSVSLTTAGLNNGGNQITNVASGLGGTKLSEATGSTLTNAANIGDLQQAVSGITNAGNGGGFGLKDEAGNSFMQNLGTATQIKGDGSKALQVGLGNDLTVGGPGKDGAPGKDGTLGVNGADGKTGVALNGKDGTIGLTGPAGANGISPTATIGVKDGAPGLNGAPGTTTTRIVYEKPDGSTEEVATLNDGLKFAGNQGDTIAKKLNETLTVKGGLANDAAASSSNLRVDSEGGALVVKMADAPTFTGEVKAEGGLTVSNHLTVKPGTTVDMGGNRITNIAAGVNDNDAVSLKQLQDVKQQVTHGNVKYEINPDGSIDYSKVVLGDGKAPNGTTVTNVAPGAVNPTSTDAVNGSQLFQTHQAINNLSNQVNEVDRNASAGTASAMAAAGLPQAYLPGKSMAAMAGATYRGQTALAVGVSTITDNGKWVIKGSVNSNSQGHVGATIGAGYQW